MLKGGLVRMKLRRIGRRVGVEPGKMVSDRGIEDVVVEWEDSLDRFWRRRGSRESNWARKRAGSVTKDRGTRA